MWGRIGIRGPFYRLFYTEFCINASSQRAKPCSVPLHTFNMPFPLPKADLDKCLTHKAGILALQQKSILNAILTWQLCLYIAKAMQNQ